jgi:hypothetical protein
LAAIPSLTCSVRTASWSAVRAMMTYRGERIQRSRRGRRQ